MAGCAIEESGSRSGDERGGRSGGGEDLRNGRRTAVREMSRGRLEASQRKRRDTPGAADKLVKVIKALFNRAVGAKPLPATIHGRLKRSINTGSFIRSAASRASRWGS